MQYTNAIVGAAGMIWFDECKANKLIIIVQEFFGFCHRFADVSSFHCSYDYIILSPT